MALEIGHGQSLRGLLLTHELAFVVLVVVAGLIGGAWAYFWQQTSAESVRLNNLSHVAQEIRSDLFRQIKEVTLARLRDDPDAEQTYSESTKVIKRRFNELRQRSETRAEAYAVQNLQQAYSTIQVDMNAIFENPYLLNRVVRSKLLDPQYEQELVGEFESAFRGFRGLINQQLKVQEEEIARWTRFAPIIIPIPIVIAAILLIVSRASVVRGFVRPVQRVVDGLRKMGDGDLQASVAGGGVTEVEEIARGIAQMATELASSQEALLDSERQAALGALVPVVAHNVRNPLASIRASAQLLDAGVEDDEIVESKKEIIETVDRLERWVSALVSYLHPLQPHARQVPAVSLFEASEKLLRSRISANQIQIVRGKWDPALIVEVDPDLMEQALYALLSNAIEASPVGAKIQIDVQSDDDRVRFGISDEAGGIPFEPEPSGLEPGPTTKRRGTGLGIPIAFKVCKAHGWDIHFNIDDGIGTEIVIVAPAFTSTPAPEAND